MHSNYEMAQIRKLRWEGCWGPRGQKLLEKTNAACLFVFVVLIKQIVPTCAVGSKLSVYGTGDYHWYYLYAVFPPTMLSSCVYIYNDL